MAIRTLPIFPLPLVLFPGTPQLLHIFEPRYRQMLADCQDGDRRFGISFVRPASAAAAPAPGAVGCQAFIQAVQPLSDGRSNILTMGEGRYALKDYVETDRPYQVAVVDPFHDEPGSEEDEKELAADVREAFTRFVTAVHSLSELGGTAVELPEEPTPLSFHVAAALDLDPAVKQELLELRAASTRLRRLRDTLTSLNADAEKRVAAHRLAKRNGKPESGPAPSTSGPDDAS